MVVITAAKYLFVHRRLFHRLGLGIAENQYPHFSFNLEKQMIDIFQGNNYRWTMHHKEMKAHFHIFIMVNSKIIMVK